MKILASKSQLNKAFSLIILSFMLNHSYATEAFREKVIIGSDRTSPKLVADEMEQSLMQEEPVAILTKYEVKKGYLKKFRKLIRKYVKQAIAQENNIMAEAYYEEGNDHVLWIIERWNSKQDLLTMRAGIKYKILTQLSKTKLIQPVNEIFIKDLEPISKTAWNKVPAKEDSPITIMLFVDSKTGTEASFKAVYHTAMPEFRGEPGVINYQLSQLEHDSSQFVTYEKFRNEDAFQFHLKFPPIQPVIDYLNTSIKKQPFQTGLHRLIEFAPVKRK